MGFFNFSNKTPIVLPDGRPLVKAKPVKKLGEKDYGMSLVEALAIQNFFTRGSETVYGGDNILYMTPAELKQSALLYHQTKRPMIEHFVNCINGTKDIHTFFESIDRLIEMSNTLSIFEKLHIYSPGYSPSEQLRVNLENMPSIEERFIKRHYALFTEKLETLKMESAKRKRLEKYFAEWSIFYYRMCPGSIQYIEHLKQWWNLDK